MEEETLKKIQESFGASQDRQDEKLDNIWRSVEKTRKYFLWTLIATIIMFVLPLIGLIFFIPTFLSVYTGALSL